MGHVQHGDRGPHVWWKKLKRSSDHTARAKKRHGRNRTLLVYCDECRKKTLHVLKGKWWHCPQCGDIKKTTRWEK